MRRNNTFPIDLGIDTPTGIVGQRITTDSGTTQSGQVSPHTELRSQITCQCANIRAGRATDTHIHVEYRFRMIRVGRFTQWARRVRHADVSLSHVTHGEFADDDLACRKLHVVAFAGKIVGTFAVDFDGGERVGNLFDGAEEVPADGVFHLLSRLLKVGGQIQ